VSEDATLDIFGRGWTNYWGKVGVNQSALIPSIKALRGEFALFSPCIFPIDY
jgi:hypothetical protein